jgi:hypothetical protein
MGALHRMEARSVTAAVERKRQKPLPVVSNAEREFWRRAVEIERSRQRGARPAPFPFQPA